MLFSNKKKEYFKLKLKSVQRKIWDEEFKREKTLFIREGIRKEYDNQKSKLSVLENKIKSFDEDKTKWNDEQKRVDDNITIFKRDIPRLEEQLKSLDVDLHGSPKTNEYPDGADGIDQVLDALRELKDMIKDYIKIL